MKGERNNKRMMGVLILIIIILALIIFYVIIIRPAISGYAVNNYELGIRNTVSFIMQQAVTCQTVPLTFGNQTINLIAIECLQQPQVQFEG